MLSTPCLSASCSAVTTCPSAVIYNDLALVLLGDLSARIKRPNSVLTLANKLALVKGFKLFKLRFSVISHFQHLRVLDCR